MAIFAQISQIFWEEGAAVCKEMPWEGQKQAGPRCRAAKPWLQEGILQCLCTGGAEGEDRGPSEDAHKTAKWLGMKDPFMRDVLTPPRTEIPAQSSDSPVPTALAGAALPAAPKSLLPWSTVGTSLFLIWGSHPIFLFFPHPLLQTSSQHSASISSLCTCSVGRGKKEDTQ